MQSGYAGQTFTVPLGTQGVLSDLGASEIPPVNLIKATNINYGLGFVEKAPGAIRYNTTGFGAAVVGVQDYWPNVIQQRMLVATADGKIWKDYGDRTFRLNVPIATGVANGALDTSCQFVIAGNEASASPKKVFFFSGGRAQVQVLSGDSNTLGAISLPASDWPNPTASSNPQSNFPKFGLVHRNRLWAFAKSVAYASSATNHEDFQTSNAILVNNIGPGEGGDILGAFVYKSRLFVFKQGDFVYYLNDTDNSSANWYFTKFAEGLGIASIHSAIQVIDDLMIGNNTGVVTSYKATQFYGDVKQGDVFKEARVSRYYRENTSVTGVPFMHSIYYSEKGRALFATRSSYTVKNDAIILVDVSQPQTPKFGLLTHYQADCLGLRRDNQNVMRPIYGAADGYVYLADRETRAVNGAAYTAEFKTPYFDMRQLDPSLAQKDKQFDYLAVSFIPTGGPNLSVDVWIDGRLNETLTVPLSVDTNYLGSFVLGTSILGSEDEQIAYVPLHGQGKRISFRGYNANALESFKITMFSVGFTPAGENPTVLSGQGG